MSERHRGLTTVLVNKARLVETLRANRADHHAKFTEAMEGYKHRAIDLLEEHIERIKANAPEKVTVTLPMPEDHTDDYDRMLAQLDWSLDDTLELNEQEFNTYVRDQWGWQAGFAQTYSFYTSN